jgi:hypothetical protein
VHERRILGAREQPAPVAAGFAVDPRAHVREDLGDVLHLVEDRRRGDGIQEALRIRSQARDDVGIFEQEIAGLGEQMLQQPGLPGAPRAREHHGREGPRGLAKLSLELAHDVPHR